MVHRLIGRGVLAAGLLLSGVVGPACFSAPAHAGKCEVATTKTLLNGDSISIAVDVLGCATEPSWRLLTDAEKEGTGYELGFLEAICLHPYASLSDPNRIEYFGECESERGPRTSVLVRRAFRNLTIPKSQIVIQPPGGVTLVNMDTLFRTDAAPYEESITLIGRNVVLKISPTQFIWNTGNGESFTTTTPGVPYDKSRSKSDYVSYKYLKPAKKLSPSVNVVWGAQYSVDGGPWQTVDGTVTTTGPSAPLRVREAVPVLTSGG